MKLIFAYIDNGSRYTNFGLQDFVLMLLLLSLLKPTPKIACSCASCSQTAKGYRLLNLLTVYC